MKLLNRAGAVAVLVRVERSGNQISHIPNRNHPRRLVFPELGRLSRRIKSAAIEQFVVGHGRYLRGR